MALIQSLTVADTATASAIRLNGYSIRETAAATAVVRLRDKNVSGQILATIALPASGSIQVMDTAGGILVPSGTIYVQVVSGAVEGAVYYA
jgi:hypothetical protein